MLVKDQIVQKEKFLNTALISTERSVFWDKKRDLCNPEEKMEVIYLYDLPIKPLGSWSQNEMTNWLHPCHGPLPDHLGMVRRGKYTYRVALWATDNNLVTMTEITGKGTFTPVQDRIISAEEEELLARKKGWILSSLLWHHVPIGFTCESETIEVPECRSDSQHDEEVWRHNVYRDVMIRSVSIIAITPIGGSLRHV